MEAANSSGKSKKKVQELPGSGLIGSIVEKNVSTPSSFPQPTVIPFPVARHRSHGPHWTPAKPKPAATADEDITAEEDDAHDSLYDPISSFADPLQRRKKKELDFSSWKHLVSGNGNSNDNSVVPERKSVPKTSTRRIKEEEEENKTAVAPPSSSVKPVTTVVREQRTAADDLPVGNVSISEEIDAENLARLSQMSTVEIAEAQEEIMGRMDPVMLDMLKKRGRDKLGKKEKDHAAPEEKKSKVGGALIGDQPSAGETRNRAWEVWRERVEKVRGLRFSLDGSVVDDGRALEQPDGTGPGCGQFNVENVAERDFLRTEGDPGAVGYTIIEAVALVRSMIPGQRSLALQLLTSVLNKALENLRGKDSGFSLGKISFNDRHIDWQAVWAFALGPEPQIVLSLRIALDDNHDSVVMSCAKAIQSILCCDLNENFFSIIEQMPMPAIDLYTAPVFRKRPEIDGGFLQGGFWKYNTKPSNLLPSNENVDDEEEGNHTIQDDIVVGGQDIAAGLIRMGILQRICYLLEMDAIPTLEECLVSVLTAFARHSPTCANAIIRCPRLIETVVKMLIRQEKVEVPAQIKAIILLKVLCKSDREICSNLMKQGVFQQAMWQWYKPVFNIEQWVESGREHCKTTSVLMVEQLRLWKVCIHYGYCVTYFSDFFSVMCLWLSLPNFAKLIEKNILREFVSITREAYLVLEALAQRLPPLHSADQLNKHGIDISDDRMETWSWSHVIPMVELAIKWLDLKKIPYLSSIIGCHKGSMDVHDPSASCMVWVLSAVLHMLCGIFDRIIPKTTDSSHNSFTQLPWLPQFVPKVGLEIVKNGFLSYMGLSDSIEEFPTDGGSLVEGLCNLRQQGGFDASLSSICCLHALIRLVFSVDSSVEKARKTCDAQTLRECRSGIANKILEEGITKWARNDLANVLTVFTTLVSSGWSVVQSVEMFGRGGPAPGIGFGWGSSGGGFWSPDVFLTQVDARLVVTLFEFFPIVLEEEVLVLVEISEPDFDKSASAMNLALHNVNSLLAVCLVAGPRDRDILEKALDLLLQANILKYLSSCVQFFLHRSEGIKSCRWKYKEEDYVLFSKALNCHFRNRWISNKRKSSAKTDLHNHSHDASRKTKGLETIHEDEESSKIPLKYSDCSSLMIEWAHQRLPLPVHWLLSAICSVGDKKIINTCSTGAQDVAKGGLLLLLCLEATSLFPCSAAHDSVISRVSLVWKFHALSVALHANMDVLEEEKSRDVFERLQELYGQHLDAARHRNIKAQSDRNERHVVSSSALPETPESRSLELLNFERQVHESYTTFVENLIEQFASISYGDTVFGRQVALYLHQSVEAPVRLAAWNALSNAHVLELLPELENCIAEPNGYLEPAEDDERILEAYVKSWISGALDRAAVRGSISFSLVLHHLSCFIFNNLSDKASTRKKLAKSLLRSYLQKTHQEGMLIKFVQYELPMSKERVRTESERKFMLLEDACDGNSSLLAVVDKLKSGLQ
ncbi:transcriptional elongation regulator MINIYO [Iris pallida]|uniref:Transcriptional elongation regulator MINIYO n=1 Tax=Iris pallida TaxID=29817 RepID=A0AAX6HUE5_IRIPA|nr:transcriptional elongation regulator MINIYO [Iris pallida]